MRRKRKQEIQKNKLKKNAYYTEKPIKLFILRIDDNIDKILTDAIKTKRKTYTLGQRIKSNKYRNNPLVSELSLYHSKLPANSQLQIEKVLSKKISSF